MIQIENNLPLYEACKDILNLKAPQDHQKVIKVVDGDFYATDGKRLLISTIMDTPDGFYMPVSVTKKVVILTPAECAAYPETEGIETTKFKKRFEATPDAVFVALLTGIGLDHDFVLLAARLGLTQTYFIGPKDPVLFSAPGTQYFVMPLIIKTPEVTDI